MAKPRPAFSSTKRGARQARTCPAAARACPAPTTRRPPPAAAGPAAPGTAATRACPRQRPAPACQSAVHRSLMAVVMQPMHGHALEALRCRGVVPALDVQLRPARRRLRRRPRRCAAGSPSCGASARTRRHTAVPACTAHIGAAVAASARAAAARTAGGCGRRAPGRRRPPPSAARAASWPCSRFVRVLGVASPPPAGARRRCAAARPCACSQAPRHALDLRAAHLAVLVAVPAPRGVQREHQQVVGLELAAPGRRRTRCAVARVGRTAAAPPG